MIRVRFAPSPTGYLHIGGVRTALFNYLYARANQGKFLLRIEDTDRERSKKEFEDEILTSLKWLGLHWDEELVYQSQRLTRYREAAEELLKRGLAYEEKLDGKTAIKFKVPARHDEAAKKQIVFHDLVHGEVSFDTSLFDDLVIIKSDGYPTYHWACVIDDHYLEISHVIRGDDHIPNTPKQALLFEAMGWKPPKYAHLPLILGADGTPLSKRHGAVSLSAYRSEGFLPEGILNYLALLGWGAEANQEFFSLEDLVKKFSLKRIQKSNARFDQEKFRWLNAQHLKKLPEAEYVAKFSDYFGAESKKFTAPKWKQLVMLYRSRVKTFKDLLQEASYCFSEVEVWESELRSTFLTNKPLKKHLEAWGEEARELPDFDSHEAVEKMTRETAQGWGIEAKDLIHPLRFALTGKTVSPGLFELMSVLGKDACLKRLEKFLKT